MKAKILEWSLIVVGALFAVIVALRLLVYDVTTIEGDDMWPTLGPGALVLVNRRATPERGDVVLFQAPDGRWQVRRVIGLPGETVATMQHALPTIDGVPIEQREVRRVTIDKREFKVMRESIAGRGWEVLDDTMRRLHINQPQKIDGGYWLLADHREYGRDSTEYGPIPRERIRGVVTIVLARGRLPRRARQHSRRGCSSCARRSRCGSRGT